MEIHITTFYIFKQWTSFGIKGCSVCVYFTPAYMRILSQNLFIFTFDKNRQNIYKNKSPCESKDTSIFSRFFHFFSRFFQLMSKRQNHTTLDMTGFEPIFINFAFFLNKNKIWDSSRLLLQTRFCCSKKLFINSLSTLKQRKWYNWLLINFVQFEQLLLNLEQ